MKMNLALIALVALMLSACASSPDKSKPQTSPQNSSANKGQNGSTGQVGSLTDAELRSKKLAEQLQQMQNNSVYFDFDDFTVKPEYHDIVRQHADVIKAHSGITVTLYGSADERGSSEYNLALGDRRAISVRKYLELSGVASNQIKTVSHGEEYPHQSCHEEPCWKENRRVDFSPKQSRQN